MVTDPEFSYDSIAAAYAAGVDSAPYNALYERPAMLALLPPVQHATVLDAGCGSGWYAAELAGRGAFVTAVDASEEMIAHARRRFAHPAPTDIPGRVELKVADLARPLLFAADGSFDGIVSSLVLHYLRDWGPLLGEFRRILKPNGWLAFSTHHPAAEAMRLGTLRYQEVELVEDYWDWVGAVRYYRRPLSAIINALTDAGLAVERVVEPLPTDEFRRVKPEAYERLLGQPDFLLILARSRSAL
jgi:SAM-dependent methyltransferase